MREQNSFSSTANANLGNRLNARSWSYTIRILSKLYETKQCFSGHVIAQIDPLKELNIMTGNFGKTFILLKGQRFATASPHPSAITVSSVNHDQVSGLEEHIKQTNKGRNLIARYTAFINRYFAHSCNSHMNEDESP